VVPLLPPRLGRAFPPPAFRGFDRPLSDGLGPKPQRSPRPTPYLIVHVHMASQWATSTFCRRPRRPDPNPIVTWGANCNTGGGHDDRLRLNGCEIGPGIRTLLPLQGSRVGGQCGGNALPKFSRRSQSLQVASVTLAHDCPRRNAAPFSFQFHVPLLLLLRRRHES
jgi:hypothetical protein